VSVSSLEDNLTESLQLARPNRLTGPIVFSDGIGSAGKRMLGHIVASLSSVEKMSHHFVFDYVAALHWLKKISDDGAITYLQTEADLQLYQQFLGRDVNFRPRDTSGVWANPGWGRYLKRLFSPEGDDVLKRLGADSPVLHEATHDGLRSASLFFRAFGERLKIVHILRNPSDLISDLYRRGFGSRVGSDPREFQLTLAGPVSPVHIYMADIAGEVSSWSALDFSAETVARSLSANLLGYKALTVGYASQVQFVFFDDLCSSPAQEAATIARFLGQTTTKRTSRAIRREGLPRTLHDRAASEAALLRRMSPKGQRAFEEAHRLYAELLEFTSEKSLS